MQVRNNHELSILTLELWKKKGMAQEIWKISILYPETSKEFYHHIKISQKYDEQKMFYKKAVLNNFLIFTEKYLFQ